MWSIFRVENEHCSNVGHFRASRDIPLPYDIPSSPETESRPSEHAARLDEEQPPPHIRHAPTAPAVDPESHTSGTDLDRTRSSTRRRRAASFGEGLESSPLTRGLTRMGTIMRNAHAQDFEKKRKPELGADTASVGKEDEDSDDDDDDDVEEHMGSVSDAEEQGAIDEVREDVRIGRAGAVDIDDVGPAGERR